MTRPTVITVNSPFLDYINMIFKFNIQIMNAQTEWNLEQKLTLYEYLEDKTKFLREREEREGNEWPRHSAQCATMTET